MPHISFKLESNSYQFDMATVVKSVKLGISSTWSAILQHKKADPNVFMYH